MYITVKEAAIQLGLKRGQVKDLMNSKLIDWKFENGVSVVDINSLDESTKSCIEDKDISGLIRNKNTQQPTIKTYKNIGQTEEKKMNKSKLNDLHERLLNGEHVLVVDYGNLNKDIYSLWYAEDRIGKYLRVFGQDGALLNDVTNWVQVKTMAIDLRVGEDIRNYEPHNTELNFLGADRLEIQEDKLNPIQRLIKDYTDLLSITTPEYRKKEPYLGYQSELKQLTEESPEYAI